MAIIAPSILAADFGRLAEQVQAAAAGGAGVIHVDVMDGHFVPNITIGPVVVAAVRRATTLPLDVHLMIEHADRYLEAFREAGADWMSVHVEASPHLQRTVSRIRALGARAGVVLNPASPVALLEDVLDDVDFVLIMSVNPGFGGQSFLPRALHKIRALRRLVSERRLDVQIEVDGGIGLDNAADVVAAGADVLVAGSAVFGAADVSAAVRELAQVAGS